jgi:FAD/FMN-containing dehydrogenase
MPPGARRDGGGDDSMSAAALDALRALLGPRGVLTEPDEMASYETGARYDRGRALAVLRPADTAQVSGAVAICVRHGLHLIAQSGNTGLVAGSTPDDSGTQVVLSLDRVTGVFSADIDNRSLTVGAGHRLSEVNRRLAADGLFFPIDLGADPGIGGMIATNTGGARFLRYGDVRANVLGLTVVLADGAGTVLDLGGPLYKNNTGVDWKQLFIGTCGAFGIVTKAVLKLHRLPRDQAAAILVPASGEAVLSLLRAMEERLGPELSAFEGMSGNAIRAALDHVPSLGNPFGGAVPDYAILAEISRARPARGDEANAEDLLQEVLADIMETEPDLLADARFGALERTWSLRHALSEGVKNAGRLIAFDLAFRRGDIMRFCDRMKAEMPARFPGVTICDFGHIGDGGVHFNLVVAPDNALATDPARECALRDWVFDVTVREFGGSFSAEHGIGRKNQRWYDLYTPDTQRRLATALHRATASAPHLPPRLGAVSFE